MGDGVKLGVWLRECECVCESSEYSWRVGEQQFPSVSPSAQCGDCRGRGDLRDSLVPGERQLMQPAVARSPGYRSDVIVVDDS